MGIPPLSFTGISDFGDDFSVILQRTFEVANLPIQNLQTEQALLLSQQQQLAELGVTLLSFRDSFGDLGLLGQNSAISATSSDPGVAGVFVTGSPSPGSYDLVVTSAASAAQEVSLTGLPSIDSGGLSSDGVYSLTVGATTTTFSPFFEGAGRTPGTLGAAAPSPPVSVHIDFSNGLSGSITANLDSFFVAGDEPSGLGVFDTVTVHFISEDGTINEQITTTPILGTTDADDLADRLNDQIAANANLAGKLTFSDEGGKLKLVESDTVGQGFTFTSSSTGLLDSGLESGGTVGGHSAEEIAAALNEQVALDSNLNAAGVQFTAVDGEVKVTGDQSFDFTVTDSAQGTGFISGLAGTHSITAFDNTLEGLQDLINGQDLGVSATIINTSSDPDAPSYHLTLTADEPGATTLRLRDGTFSDLLTTGNQGEDAVFTINGLPVTNSGNTITDFAPGLTLTIEGPGSTTITVAPDSVAVANSLADIAAAYNAVVGKLDAQIGKNAGVLSGNVIVRQAKQVLRDITSFAGSGSIHSIVEVGLEFDENGLLSFNSTTFNKLTSTQLDDVISFIGDTSTGFAGLAYSKVKELADPVAGLIKTTIDSLEDSDTSLQKQIDAASERVDRLIATLEQQFAATDLLLSRLEAQQNVLTSIFEAYRASQLTR